MAGIWADFPSGSQGLYGTSAAAMTDGAWSNVVTTRLSNDPDPSIGSTGKVLDIGWSGTNGYVRYALPSAQATVGIARRFFVAGLPTNRAGPRVFVWRNAGNGIIAYIYVTTTGGIGFVNSSSDSAAPTYETAGPVITANSWWHIEAKLICGTSSNATIEVRVNGVTKIVQTGFSTSSATCSSVSMERGDYGSTIGGQSFCKDFVLWDGTGSQVNDFQGTVNVYYQPPTVDVTSGGWTLSSGTSISSLIGIVGPPVDTSYIAASSVLPVAAQIKLGALPADITSVRFVIPLVRAAKVDGGDGNIQISLTPDGVNFDNGPNTPVTTAFTYWGNSTAPFVSHLNPLTGTAWTPVDFATGVIMKINRTV